MAKAETPPKQTDNEKLLEIAQSRDPSVAAVKSYPGKGTKSSDQPVDLRVRKAEG